MEDLCFYGNYFKDIVQDSCIEQKENPMLTKRTYSFLTLAVADYDIICLRIGKGGPMNNILYPPARVYCRYSL